ncbi:MAG: MFS transporter, partial [Anaerolineales bacterium]|nr:MFS transporter [Anaerolineales bacterium]
KKVFPVHYGFFLQRLPILLLAPTAYLLATSQPTAALIVFMVLYAWYTIGSGVQTVGWQDMIAKIFPADRRGRFFGITNFVGNAAGILGALAVPVILDRFGFPLGFVIAFALASFLILLSWIALALTREPAIASTRPAVSQAEFLRSLPDVLRRDRNFRQYLLAAIVFYLSGMATSFLAVHAVQQWNLSDAEAGGFTIAMQIGLAAANLFFGFLSDRTGHKLSLEICSLLSLTSLVLAFLAPSPAWFYVVFFLRGAVNAGTFISGISIVYEFADDSNRATYIGLSNTIPGVAGAVAPLVGGWLAGGLGYPVMFALSAVVGVTSWALLHFSVRDPRHKAAGPAPTVTDAHGVK